MAKFLYKVKDTSGQTHTGTIDASDTRSVYKTLRNQGLFVIEIKESLHAFVLGKVTQRFHSVSRSDITNFTRQLSVMLSTGLTLTDGLAVLNTQTSNPNLRKITSDLIVEIEGGASFSQALGRHSDVFPEIYVSVIGLGETSGLLDKMLTRLADNLEQEREFRSKVRGALVYPIIILIGMAVVMGIMMLFVVPQLSLIYGQVNIPLPLPTKIVIGTSNFFVSFWYVVIALLLGAFFGLLLWKKTNTGKYIIDAMTLKLPVWGKLQRAINLTELTRTLSLLVGTGTPIVNAVENVSRSARNILFGEAMDRVGKKIEKGVSLGTAFSHEQVFPPLIAQMARVGEETGKLDEVMMKISEYFEGEAERTVKALTTLLEPLIMIVLGVAVGFLMISVILPIYNLAQAI